MPAPLLSREEVLERILAEFRLRGFDASSLSDLSSATGLGRSSLYHHFPDGKQQMAAEVLARLLKTLESDVFSPLRQVRPAKKRLDGLLDAIDAFYRGGKDACLLERLTASTQARSLQRPLRETFIAMMTAFEEAARDAGLTPAVARARAEEAVIGIEGALVVSAGMGETGPFERVIRSLRRDFLENSDRS
jgi:AcrR family transcriptional regulator